MIVRWANTRYLQQRHTRICSCHHKGGDQRERWVPPNYRRKAASGSSSAPNFVVADGRFFDAVVVCIFGRIHKCACTYLSRTQASPSKSSSVESPSRSIFHSRSPSKLPHFCREYRTNTFFARLLSSSPGSRIASANSFGTPPAGEMSRFSRLNGRRRSIENPT